MAEYKDLKADADRRWEELTQGSRPWIRVGAAMCGQAAGALDVIDAIRSELERTGIDARVDSVGCIGLCYAEPIVDILKPGSSRLFFGDVSPSEVPQLLDSVLNSDRVPVDKTIGYLGPRVGGVPDLATLPGIGSQEKIALRNAGNIAPDDIYQYIANGGYRGLARALNDMRPDGVVDEMKASGLRGRGGAGFPTGVKWSFMARGGPPKYILCNCEEGDPGAYNDKGILESDPYTLIEGMTLAGYATSASNGFVFIRHGHDGPISRTERAIEQAYEVGLLGKNILDSDFSFDIEVSLTGESYVAGEETALMESIEGKRSMPRFKPPFPAAFGVWGKPSTINNVKSFSYAPQIVAKGGDWFKSVGRENCTGTAIVCLSGDVNRPGMYEVPMGTRLGDVVEDIGGGTPSGRPVKLIQLGGPLGHILGAESLDYGLDFDEMREHGAMLGSGGVIVGDDTRCAVDMARLLVAFCQYESCGKCFPCRLGMTQLLEMIERIADKHASPGDVDLMNRVGSTMESSSLCFHGQLGYNPLRSALVNFPDDFRAHIEEGRCPHGDCDEPLLAPRNTRAFAEEYRTGAAPVQVLTR